MDERSEYPTDHPETLPDGIVRPGVVYVDDSTFALDMLRRTAFGRGVLIETYTSLARMFARDDRPLRAVLLDVDLGSEGEQGPLSISRIRANHPDAAIAFVTAEAGPERRALLEPFARVFDKQRDMPEILAWVLSFAPSASRHVRTVVF